MSKYNCIIKANFENHSNYHTISHEFDANNIEEMFENIILLKFELKDSVKESILYGINVLENKEWNKNTPKFRCWSTMLRGNSGNPKFLFYFPEDKIKSDKIELAFQQAKNIDEFETIKNSILND